MAFPPHFSRLGFCFLASAILLGGCRGGNGEAPTPFVPPAEGAPECELSADCPAGTHCDLGECVQVCHVEAPCGEDLVCTARGQCRVEASTDPIDPPPVASHVAVLSSSDEVVTIGKGAMVAMFAVEAQPTDREIRYRVDPRVPWLKVTEPRGTFRGALSTLLEVDRSSVGPGTHSGTVVVHSSAGKVTIPVRLEQSLSGVYQGEIVYEEPRALGRIPFRVEIREEDRTFALRVDSSRSPTFPVVAARQPTATGALDRRLRADIVQQLGPADLGGSDALLDRALGREFRMNLESTPQGGLTGAFTERWFGIFPAPVEVAGMVHLHRVDDEPGEFTVSLPPELPPNPNVNPPPLTNCTNALPTAERATCAETAAPSRLHECGTIILGSALRIENTQLVGPSGYANKAAACATDLDATTYELPDSAVPSCIRPGSLSCAKAYFGRAIQLGHLASYTGLGNLVAGEAGVGSLLLNEQLVTAFEAPFRSDDDALESIVGGALDEGRSRARQTLRSIFQPFVLETLRTTPRALAVEADFRALRRIAQLISQERLAAEEEASLLLRTRPFEKDALRAQLNRDAINLLVALVSLSVVESGQGAPPSAELSLFAESLTDLGKRSLQAWEDLDPFGLPSGYVEFIYDPLMAGMRGVTNFQQVLNSRRQELEAARNAEIVARDAIRQYDENVEALARELSDIALATNQRLIAICGARMGTTPPAPDLEECGTRGVGELAQARSVYAQEVEGVQIAVARIQALDERVRIQEQRLAEVLQIRRDQIGFINSTNQRILANEVRLGEIEAAEKFISIASQGNLFNGFAPVAGAVAAGVLTLKKTQIQEQQQRLRQTQDLRIREDDNRIERINGLAAIKEMLIGMGELNIELNLAGIRASTAAMTIATLEEQIQVLQAEHEYLRTRTVESLRNDPAFRVVRNRAVRRAIAARDQARRGIYLAARAFEFETNFPFPAIATDLVPAFTAARLEEFVSCLESNFTNFRSAFGVPQTFVDEVSLRRDVLGIRGPVVDPVTGEEISEAEQFQRLLLSPSNIGPDGTVGFSFVTTLNPGNGVFSTMVCNDQLQSVQVKIIGDGLGDDQARIYLWHGGTSLMRGCESFRLGQSDVIREYDLIPKRVEVQAGVNAYPSAPMDAQLFGRPVAATNWRIAIPPGLVAPTNADLDPMRIDDIVIRLEHSAISLSESPINYAPTCAL